MSKMRGPLAPYAAGFYGELRHLGYPPASARWQMQLMSHASRWLSEHRRLPHDLTPAVVDEFLALRRAQGRKEWISRRGIEPLLRYLRGRGVVPVPAPVEPQTQPERLLAAYRDYLARERGLTPATIATYLAVARRFLAAPACPAPADLAALRGADVLAFVTRDLRTRRRGSAPAVATGVRALLRFLFLDGRIAQPLAEVVPRVAHWRLRPVPPRLAPDHLARLLDGCDRHTADGLRAWAICTLLARLGLRAGEVAGLTLRDIDWRRGVLTVHGKGPRQETLPLPADVGQALVAWLQHGRPRDAQSAVFTRLRAPHRPLTSAGVSHVVAAACRHADLEPFHAHRLRHAAATQMLDAGASLEEIGQVLRHRRYMTTAIYAKVTQAALGLVARPWPEGRS